MRDPRLDHLRALARPWTIPTTVAGLTAGTREILTVDVVAVGISGISSALRLGLRVVVRAGRRRRTAGQTGHKEGGKE
jgi:hypothetical protein